MSAVSEFQTAGA